MANLAETKRLVEAHAEKLRLEEERDGVIITEDL